MYIYIYIYMYRDLDVRGLGPSLGDALFWDALRKFLLRESTKADIWTTGKSTNVWLHYNIIYCTIM